MKQANARKSPAPATPPTPLDAHQLRHVVGGDVYLQYPRGSNNRSDGG
ncbi:MAG TPA: hypothetical protein VFP84_22480 [Kofleriaceae bacterium]|nr:hypothetical protein [Kofleriaceae bacterium]